LSWHYDNNGPPYQAYALAEKLRETAELKKLLFKLAMSVIAATIATQIAATLVFTFLPVFPDHPNWGAFIISLEIESSVFHGRDIAYFLMWLANDIIMYVPPLLIFGLVFFDHMDYQKPGTPYKFRYVWVFPLFFAGYALVFGSSILTELIADAISRIFGGRGGLPDVFSGLMPENNTQLLVMLFTVGVAAPICEETIYRHILLKPLRRYGDLQAVLITSVLFGFYHGNFTQFLYAVMIGFILGVAAVKANSVFPAILIHMFNNVFVVFNSHYHELFDTDIIALGELSLFSLVVIIPGIVALAVMAVKGMLTVDNYNPHLNPAERRRIIATRPSLIVMAIILLLLTVLGTL